VSVEEVMRRERESFLELAKHTRKRAIHTRPSRPNDEDTLIE
jgi:hypothetical protein